MADSSKPSFLQRRYLLDRPSQLRFSLAVVSILAGIGVLYAFAVYVIVDTELLRDKTVAQTRLVLLLVHAAYFLVGGAILFAAVLLLTHRFVGPAYVMRQAVARMRRGDFGARLNLRRADHHKSLAEQLRLLRDELAERDTAQAQALERLRQCLDDGDTESAREVLRAYLERAPRAEPANNEATAA